MPKPLLVANVNAEEKGGGEEAKLTTKAHQSLFLYGASRILEVFLCSPMCRAMPIPVRCQKLLLSMENLSGPAGFHHCSSRHAIMSIMGLFSRLEKKRFLALV